MKHLFIINPIAGGNKESLNEIKHEVESFAKNLTDPYEVYITKAPMEATRKVIQEAESVPTLRVYAIGGDGTLNECANGAANRPNVAITQYANGTGNDFIRTFGQENLGKFRDLDALTSGSVRSLDLIDCNGRYGINICSVGIDARVGRDVHTYSSIPIIGGATGYIIALLVNVLRGVTQRFRITTENEIMEKAVTLACACNGRFYGGGFNPVPDALPDDGIIEYLIINGVSRLQVAKIVGKYAKGQYRKLPNIITHLRGSNLKIEADQEFLVNIDGEIIHAKTIEFKLAKKGVNFIFPKNMRYFDGAVL